MERKAQQAQDEQKREAEREAAIRKATDPASTPFDYIVIGSGAGGGPLAARLALAGRRVLVVEAGVDPVVNNPRAEVYNIPAYNGAATEDPVTSWDFSVRHYGEKSRQAQDSKYDPTKDPESTGGKGKGGIFYPRAAALGGCTSHHAMIMIRPNNSDWDDIAKFTGDDSWRSGNMQGYFPKIEKNLYYDVYKHFFGRILGGILAFVQWLATFINPRSQLDPNGHGFKGWQPTSFIDPIVIAAIARGDWTFLRLLLNVASTALTGGGIWRAIRRFQIIQFLDPNVPINRSVGREQREKDLKNPRLSLISIGTDGKQRSGLREWLVQVAADLPDHLVLLTGAHATRLIFTKDQNEPAPRVVGVEVVRGAYLYKASKGNLTDADRSKAVKDGTAKYFASAEVIVSGGSFNTPQLLMLSGIGDAAMLKALGIAGPRDADGTELTPVIDLPGVGRNLQDRYEVSVISEMKSEFSTLKDVSFIPGDIKDPVFKQWEKDRTGLYATNGGALAMLLASSAGMEKVKNRDEIKADLFIFGVPAAFRGYYWNWSNELLKPTKGALKDQRNLWTWVILKAYTDNNYGNVKLRSSDPFDVPDINFRSFVEGPPGHVSDIAALCEAVERTRAINAKIKGMKGEIQPGASRPDASADLSQWVQDEAWGHHACGTCRIGSDRQWRPDVTALQDRNAVLHSSFKVHGIDRLRVVDASVFPKIPGYFIVTPVFMIGEKAADTILADSATYPARIEELEAKAVYERRGRPIGGQNATSAEKLLPRDSIGLALSGGGVRAATYCLGVLQALAATKMLPRIDFLSPVSGGGYIAGFLGRLYSRMAPDTPHKAERIEAIVNDPNSSEIWWLRRHANYLAGAGRSDLETNLAVFARNLATVLFCVGALFLAGLGALRLIADWAFPAGSAGWEIAAIPVSPWWRAPTAVLLLAALPLAIGYWLTPPSRSRWSYSIFGVLAWLMLLGSAIVATGITGLRTWGLVATGVLILAWLWQEGVRLGVHPEARRKGFTALYHNRLARALGSVLILFAATVVFVVIDSLARIASTKPIVPIMAGSALIVSPFLPFIRDLAVSLIPASVTATAEKVGIRTSRIALNILAFSLAALLFFAVDVIAHGAFERGQLIGIWVVAASLVVSLALGQALSFLNMSSLQQQLTQKIARTFLGATNDERIHPVGTTPPVPVQVSDANDDTWLSQYHPEKNGGPLHLLNVCINQTVDHISGRQLSQNKGLSMCLGPTGISVGRHYHATWEKRRSDLPLSQVEVRALPAAPDPHQFHVLARSGSETATVEHLTLGRWMAISAASVSTGAGRRSSLPMSLLLGLLNVRLGYWWNSGINPGRRPGRYPPDLWRRIKSLPSTVFAAQALLLNEWRGYFEGPSARRWYLSDGGHFDNTGVYELIRRRLPFIIAVDAGQDEGYEFDDLAILMRQVRLDFGAELNWLDPGAAGAKPWSSLNAAAATQEATIPAWIQALIQHPEVIGGLGSMKRDGPSCAALARISYPDRESWLLLIKANLAPKVRADVRNYALMHPSFPNEPTLDQFFDDDQWESYRSLGECAARALFDQ
ncbi:GMC oxidoreductase [Mesorhizobium onobrychidis]|uniref:GMC family oxidoreductase N-terminal domain-containing protein n=1 Tax=Mesorhizobium onobrychidis TaxID=2775404 RepID=A0ABY5R7D9_9HYPH|nr:GMC oxidoreductase [Mesorhizobium onobrychidis]UVC19430.1 GMC family oxidoreductase N-terminal domain-containing protein [Mesorhizobium onobrychidis]